jgi:uncharacterized membrane protein YphA (DoxX/SURF4 family)
MLANGILLVIGFAIRYKSFVLRILIIFVIIIDLVVNDGRILQKIDLRDIGNIRLI